MCNTVLVLLDNMNFISTEPVLLHVTYELLLGIEPSQQLQRLSLMPLARVLLKPGLMVPQTVDLSNCHCSRDKNLIQLSCSAKAV